MYIYGNIFPSYGVKVKKDDSLLAFSVALILAYFVFSLVAVFMEKFSDQNHLL